MVTGRENNNGYKRMRPVEAGSVGFRRKEIQCWRRVQPVRFELVSEVSEASAVSAVSGAGGSSAVTRTMCGVESTTALWLCLNTRWDISLGIRHLPNAQTSSSIPVPLPLPRPQNGNVQAQCQGWRRSAGYHHQISKHLQGLRGHTSVALILITMQAPYSDPAVDIARGCQDGNLRKR